RWETFLHARIDDFSIFLFRDAFLFESGRNADGIDKVQPLVLRQSAQLVEGKHAFLGDAIHHRHVAFDDRADLQSKSRSICYLPAEVVVRAAPEFFDVPSGLAVKLEKPARIPLTEACSALEE